MSFKEFKKGIRTELDDDTKALPESEDPAKRIDGKGGSR
jgi:hypothetical protein